MGVRECVYWMDLDTFCECMVSEGRLNQEDCFAQFGGFGPHEDLAPYSLEIHWSIVPLMIAFTIARARRAWRERKVKPPELMKVSDFYKDGELWHAHRYSEVKFSAAINLLREKPEQVKFVNWKSPKISAMSTLLQAACIGSGNVDNWQEANRERLELLRLVRKLDCQQFKLLLQDYPRIAHFFGDSSSPLPVCRLLVEISMEIDIQPKNALSSYYWREFLHGVVDDVAIDIQAAYEGIISGQRIVSGRTVDEDDLDIEAPFLFDSALFWDKIKLLTLVSYHKVTDETKLQEQGKNFRLLHACAGTDWFPDNLLKLLVVAFPHALLEDDEDGNLPIHVATKGKFESYDLHDLDEFAYNLLRRRTSVARGHQKATIDILLDAIPHTARIPNREGKLPLELALESGRDWTDGGMQSLLAFYPRAAAKRHASGKLPLEWLILSTQPSSIDGCRKLLEAYPQAACRPNPKSGKYPLQVAIDETQANDKSREKKVALLLKYYSTAASSIDPSSQLPMSFLAAAQGMSLTTIYSLFLSAPVLGAGPKLERLPKTKVTGKKKILDGVCRCKVHTRGYDGGYRIPDFVVQPTGVAFLPCCNKANFVAGPFGVVIEPTCNGQFPDCWQNKKTPPTVPTQRTGSWSFLGR